MQRLELKGVVVPKRIAWEVRAEAYRLLALGVSAVEVGRRLRVNDVTVWSWAKVGMRQKRGAPGGAVPVAMDVVVAGSAGRSYRRLTLADRAVIQAGRAMSPPLSVRAIARMVGMSASTVSRELRRNAVQHWGQDRYSAHLAHHRALLRRSRPTPRRLEDPALRGEVVSRLNLRFSPQQVSGQLRVEFPDDEGMRVSHETIYQALYLQGRGALRHELTVQKALRSGRTGRIPRSKLPARSNRPWLDGARLTDRPAEVAERAVPGHWEGDLVVGPANSGIVTLVERQTRFVLLGRLPGARDSATVIDVLQTMISHLPAELTRTITWDQGQEMAGHARFTIATGCPVFFCDPHSPWQRGSNENTNGLIRDFYPKGTNFNTITDTDLAETQRLLNIRPRQTLGFHTPAATLDQLLNRVALTP
ncbi:IS30 family transposase [Cnuibacter physcomitrellae]|uniref:IS30 family transposase n=1 Tax=Cnuibacter physcomitrellae TaxID=1619308 RepID=UPI002175F4B3|nr:IS30 family transposase [Cnuibacter physcomitrellae]MCS5496491.1 IS30 family transposase [Cnuibacter physcomitrellae]